MGRKKFQTWYAAVRGVIADGKERKTEVGNENLEGRQHAEVATREGWRKEQHAEDQGRQSQI